MGMATVPAWYVATRRVQKVLNNQTVPLLAVFSAFSFTIMMFNIPVPGGTTAHGVGGTLLAIVLGPWAAIIGVSTALIIQALFFGDGGVLAIFANCFNMGILLPVVGYLAYRAIAGQSPVLSRHRVWAAGIGSYIGITVSALAVGLELGVQPILFTSSDGHPLYSPYGLAATLPAMLLAHALGASIVEALITAFGLAYLQRSHPEYLVSLRSVVIGRDVEAGSTSEGSIVPAMALAILVSLGALFGAGLITGGGDVSHLFGADWSAVDWPGVATMLVVTMVIAAVLLPLARLVLPRPAKGVGTAFVAAAVIAPLGLIAPGFAYGEGSPDDVNAAFGYVPQGLQDLSGLFSAPLAGYNLPLPFFAEANAPLWHQAVGYEVSGILGIVVVGALVFGLAFLLRSREPSPAYAGGSFRQVTIVRRHANGGRIGWVENTLGGIAASIEQAVFTEEHSRKDGMLQHLDPRAKLGMFLVVVLAASLSASLPILLMLYVVLLLAARASRVPFDFFVKRVWIGIPFFAGIVIIPSIFLAPGPRLFDLLLGPLHLGLSIAGLAYAAVFVARVGVSVSVAVLLVLTTPWADVLKSLQSLRIPRVFILILSMSYRYIFLFLHSANGMIEGRKSRTVGRTTGGEQRRWISASMGALMNRSFKMSNDVYAAMLARGFTGQIRTYSTYRMTSRDWLGLAGAVSLAAATVVLERIVK
jgi:cobalt ECF transporter T component CbiQ/cobalamin biosynthesis protein CbiM